jgi:DNA topoisomerase-2
MTAKEAPKITACKASDNWTCITFKPDLAKFGMEQLEDETIGLMRRRVYDLAGILGKGVKVDDGGVGNRRRPGVHSVLHSPVRHA